MRLDDDMRRVVREQSLGFVATVCPDGTPNLSPKGTTVVWDDEHLAFLHIHSPTTVANLQANPAIEVNVVDPIVRKGYRFKGTAVVLTDGDVHAGVLDFFARAGHRHHAGPGGRARPRGRRRAGRVAGVRFRRHGSRGRGPLACPPSAARRSDGLRHIAVAGVGDPYPGGSG